MPQQITLDAAILGGLLGSRQRDQVTMTVDELNAWLDYEVEEYTGDRVGGMRHGHGTGRWPDGKQYVG